MTGQVHAILDKRLGIGLYEGRGRLQKIERRIKVLLSLREKVEQLLPP